MNVNTIILKLIWYEFNNLQSSGPLTAKQLPVAFHIIRSNQFTHLIPNITTHLRLKKIVSKTISVKARLKWNRRYRLLKAESSQAEVMKIKCYRENL